MEGKLIITIDAERILSAEEMSQIAGSLEAVEERRNLV